MPTLTITRGLPASGKTTWAKNHAIDTGASRVNRDDLRRMMFGKAQGLSWEQEKSVTVASRTTARAILAEGREVVADDMNLRPRYVREWANLAREVGAELVVHEMPIDVDTCRLRDRLRRPRDVGDDVIRGLAQKYVRGGTYLPVPETEDAPARAPYVPRPGSPYAVMVDIDGTLANHGDRSPYDWSRVGEDTPVHAVIDAVHAARDAGADIIFCSGRSDECRTATLAWLDTHVGVCADDVLLMRAAGDYRRDSVVKVELFDEHVRDRYRVGYVLDDRRQVVDAWRAIGLTVFQVAPGDF